MLDYDWRWEYVTNNRDLFLNGLKLSLWMALVGLLAGTIIGLILAFLRASGNPILKLIAVAYVEIFRNVPLLLLIFFMYYGFPRLFERGSDTQIFIRDHFGSKNTFIFTLAIYAGAYLTEIFYAGILSVGRRYLDAGRSLGLHRFQLARYITTPIMFRTVLPSLSSTFISLFKDTSIAFSIAVMELSFAANKISTDYFRVFEAWLAAGVLYVATSYLLAVLLRFGERRIRWSV